MGGKQLPQTIKINACQKILRIKMCFHAQKYQGKSCGFSSQQYERNGFISNINRQNRSTKNKCPVVKISANKKYKCLCSIRILLFVVHFYYHLQKVSGKLNDISKYFNPVMFDDVKLWLFMASLKSRKVNLLLLKI